jgi:hypothetical protein
MLGLEAIGLKTNPTFYEKISIELIILTVGFAILFVFTFFKARSLYNSKGGNRDKNCRVNKAG